MIYKFLIYSILCFVFFASGAPPLHAQYQSFEARAAYVGSLYDTILTRSYSAAFTKYAHNRDVHIADSMLLSMLPQPQGDMFWMQAAIATYIVGKEKMSPEVRIAFRNAWKTYASYRGDTENHWCMYYTGLLLACEQWPGLPGSEWFNGKSSTENYAEAAEYLRHWMDITTTIGQGEYDSPDYLPEYINPMVLLSEFAQTEEMRLRGRMMLDYILADFAVDHLNGQYVGGASRITEPAVYKPGSSNAAAFAWLYFGMGTPSQLSWLVFPSLCKYRVPQIIQDIATDRRQPYVHQEKKRVRNVLRGWPEPNPPVYKYNYMTQDYGMGSINGPLLVSIQQHTWNLHFRTQSPYSTIFGLHPFWSGEALRHFFPEEVKSMVADISSSKTSYNNEDKWTGGSPYERVFQHRNTLIGLYDIAEGAQSGHIDGFFPKDADTLYTDQSGWIVFRSGEVFTGWFPLQPVEWKEVAVCKRLRSVYLQNGYVVEARSKTEMGSFEKFVQRLRTHIPVARLAPGQVSVQYTTLDGEQLRAAFPEMFSVNGKLEKHRHAKLFEGPYLNAKVGSRKLKITHGKDKLTLDFNRLRVE